MKNHHFPSILDRTEIQLETNDTLKEIVLQYGGLSFQWTSIVAIVKLHLIIYWESKCIKLLN